MAATGDFRAARRYASALFNVALERNETDAVAQNLADVTSTVTQSPQLMGVLHHPRVTRQKKQEILATVFHDQVRPDVEHLLLMLVEKDRADIIPNVASEFARLLDEHRKEADAEAISAVPLSSEQQAHLENQLQAATGYKVRLKTRVDENILGGLIVRVGDKLIDASVATQLAQLRNKLKQVKVN
jgi:F-type H+-transporting ATPase subunit delta